MNKICKHCGKTYIISMDQFKGFLQEFCSVECNEHYFDEHGMGRVPKSRSSTFNLEFTRIRGGAFNVS